jgi:hypothetical protein
MLALKYPVIALAVVALCLILIVTFAAWIFRAVRRRFSRAPVPASA